MNCNYSSIVKKLISTIRTILSMGPKKKFREFIWNRKASIYKYELYWTTFHASLSSITSASGNAIACSKRSMDTKIE